MKVAVYASEGFDNYKILSSEVLALLRDIDNGGDSRVDFCFPHKHRELRNLMRSLRVGHSEWHSYPLVQGTGNVYSLRQKVLDSAPHILIFWNGTSAGTRKLIDMAEKANKNYRVVMV